MKIQISNVNTNNHAHLAAAAAIAGYSASIELVNETTRTIELGDEAHRDACGITAAEVDRMISSLVLLGFSIQRV